MRTTASSTGRETPGTTAGGENRHDARIRHSIEVTLWVLGLITLATAGYLTHQHPGPWPGELAFSRAVQSIHYPSWVLTELTFFSLFNDIPPSAAAIVICVAVLALMRWYRQALFLALTVGIGNGIDALIGDVVGRPRPDPKLIHVTSKLVFNSFPSGHTEHDVVFYGFLLYLSFTKPVREWRYHWMLLPLQIFAVLAILSIGYSRIYMGEHWISDVLAGYLSGLLWLFLFIFLYRWTTTILARRRARRAQSYEAVRDTTHYSKA